VSIPLTGQKENTGERYQSWKQHLDEEVPNESGKKQTELDAFTASSLSTKKVKGKRLCSCQLLTRKVKVIMDVENALLSQASGSRQQAVFSSKILLQMQSERKNPQLFSKSRQTRS
jgi:hypothetical protein